MDRRSTRRTLLLAVGAGAVMAIAPATGAAATGNVQAGDVLPPDADFNAFLPSRITVRRGDRVSFTFRGFHTVIFPKRGTRPGPVILPNGPAAPATPDAAGQPFWWTGVPQLTFNPKVFGPVGGTLVTGARTVGSGIVPGRNAKFTVSFPKAGNYTYFCGIHPGMKGSVRVLPRKAGSPNPDVATARAVRERAAFRRQARREGRRADRARSNTEVSIGFGRGPVHLFRFVPAATQVSAGATVTFRMGGNREVHTVTFGPADYVKDVQQKSFAPGVQVLDPRATFPSDPPAVQPVPHTSTVHGNGFLNSGVLVSPPAPGPRRFSVRFDTPGTYGYSCLIHPQMRGQVTVS